MSTSPPKTSEQLKRLAKDTSYSRLAGSFNQYAAGEMALGAGAGMAQGGGAVSGAFLGMGLGMGGVAAGQPQRPDTSAGDRVSPGVGLVASPVRRRQAQRNPAQPQPATVACAPCSAPNPPGAKFCMGCGQALAPQDVCTARTAAWNSVRVRSSA